MNEETFVRYLNKPDVHDGIIRSVSQDSDLLRVTVQTQDGRLVTFEFRNVQSIKMNRPEGMMLYALCESRETPPGRRFVFGNWDEEDDAFLEVVANDISSQEIADESK